MKGFFSKIKHQNIAEEFDESKCKALTKIFIEEKFQDAVAQAEQYFIKSYNGTYNQYIDEVKSTQKINCCLFSWNTPTLSGVCLDCQQFDDSCLCIPCFLAKHHENHQSYITYYSAGSCDCGDPLFIKPTGFCSHHPGPDPNPDVTQMTKENRTKFITVFRAAFTAVFLYSPYGRSKKEKSKSERYKKPKKLIDYIKGFIPYGDGIRRCVAYAIIPVLKEHFFKAVQDTDAGLIENIVSLFGPMISDVYFRDRLGILTFREFNQLFNQMCTCIFNKRMESGKYLSLHTFLNFTGHFFTQHPVLYALNKESFKWSDFLVSYISNIYLPISMSNFEYDNNFEAGIFNHFGQVFRLLKIVVGLDDQHSNIQDFINGYSNFLNKNERKVRFYVRTTPQDENDDGYTACLVTDGLSLINSAFCPNFKYSSAQNTEYSLSKVFENLVEYLDRANIKAESILNAQESCPISTLVMLHTLFFAVLAGCKNPKEELKLLCEKRKWAFDYFCSIVIVCPLRVIATLFSFSKFSKINKGHKVSIKHLLGETSFIHMFGLVQLILSICDNKSKVMNSILTTFGVFDDISDYEGRLSENEFERQKSLFEYAYFDCAIFVLSLLTDNTVLSFDSIKFKRFRVIELLKRSKATVSEIENHVNEKFNNPIFADDLLEYIERVTRKNGGSYFRLKSDGDFNPFFPAVTQMDRLTLLGKYNDQLFPLSEGFEDLKRGISLKECFKTPEFFCLCFHLLSSPNSNAVMKKVGLAMCMCFINNTTKFPPQSYKENSPVTIVAPSLKELIKSVAENDVLKKENWLTANFQIESNKQEKSSLIKLILMQENLGKMVIEKTGLPDDLCRNEADEKQRAEKDRVNQLIKEKKAKAELLKQRLMKDFQNRRKQFTSLATSDTKDEQEKAKNEASSSNNNLGNQSEDDEDEFDSSQQVLTDGSSNVLCNVCLSQQDDIFGVPCLSLPSIIASLVSMKTHKKSKSADGHKVAYMMNICRHFVHYKCYVKMLSEAVKADPNAKTYHCMMDRGLRNCFLPVFDKVRVDASTNNINYDDDDNDDENQSSDLFTQKPSVMTKVAITDFIRRAFDEKAAADLLLPLRSFAAAVLMLEVRHRNRPDVLDSPSVPLLLRNLLLTIYHGLHARVAKSSIEADQIKDEPLLRLVLEVVKSDDPCAEFHEKVKEIVQSIGKKSSSSRVLEFLRRAAIVEDIAINPTLKNEPFIDWDEVLSEENLTARFGINQTSFHKMKKFKMVKLPKKFIGLFLQPFNIDICDSSIEKALDLLTGDVVRLKKKPKAGADSDDDDDDLDEKSAAYKSIDVYEKEVYNGGLAMYLVLTGPRASSVMFHSEAIGKTWMIDSFYVDQFGDTDHGFNRGIITKLSKDSQSNVLDKFLSGEVTLY